MTNYRKFIYYLLPMLGLSLILAACYPSKPAGSDALSAANQDSTATATATATALEPENPTPSPTEVATATTTASPTASPTATSTPSPTPTQANALIGPNLDDFPPGYNPLTGLPVADPVNLNLPAVLISITNFPPSSRPQAGTSFAPYIFELFISEGMTRFLTLFYGDYPEPEMPVSGDCAIRTEPFMQTEDTVILGNYVWLDGNGNGVQDFDEAPVSGVCVNLYDASTDEVVASTSTDSNGYYGFNVEPERSYYLKFPQPTGKTFTTKDIGADDYADSDVDPATGTTPSIALDKHDFSWDVGLIGGQEGDDGGDGNGGGGNDDGDGEEGGNGEEQGGQEEQEGEDGGAQKETEQQESQETITSQDWIENPGQWLGNWISDIVIGPVRSGRLPYRWIRDWYYQACLIYAGKSYDVDIPGCASVFGDDKSDINSAFISVTRLKEIAEQSKTVDTEINYSGNYYLNTFTSNGIYTGSNEDVGGLFPSSGSLPDGTPFPNVLGDDAQEVLMFYNYYNQALWRFDPLSGGYLRYTDLADGTAEFYPATDRLNGRQLIFHNVIILFADHNAIQPTIIDVDLAYTEGRAILFRDGRAYNIVWKTYGGDYEKETGLQRPIKFVDTEGNAIPLHPGQTWVHIVTNTTSAWEESPGKWKVRFYAPPGTK
ncbi:MAG: SdrD B-like domain-containing protein [Chloroflexota bacterium]|nr:SdrD B-like domain-containing protein [Chloroflexota bacterium]